MPLEIRELVIKASIGDEADNEADVSNSDSSGSVKESDVNLIVEKVLEMLKEISER